MAEEGDGARANGVLKRWYKHPDKIWALGEVVQQEDLADGEAPPEGSVVLAVDGGRRITVSLADTHIHNATHTNPGLQDLATMDNMHEVRAGVR